MLSSRANRCHRSVNQAEFAVGPRPAHTMSPAAAVTTQTGQNPLGHNVACAAESSRANQFAPGPSRGRDKALLGASPASAKTLRAGHCHGPAACPEEVVTDTQSSLGFLHGALKHVIASRDLRAYRNPMFLAFALRVPQAMVQPHLRC